MELTQEFKVKMNEPGLFHVGIAVSNIEIATSFFQRIFGFKLVLSRTASHNYLGQLVGRPGVQAQINMLRIDENNLLEILEWKPIHLDNHENADNLRIHERGAQHLCFYTHNADLLYSKLKLEEVEFISEAPIIVEVGPNKGAKVFFIKVFGFLYLEIFQKPPNLD